MKFTHLIGPLFGFLLLTNPTLVMAKTAYRYQNANGEWVFTDTATPGAQAIDLKEAPTYAAPQTNKSSTKDAKPKKEDVNSYQISLLNPTPNLTLGQQSTSLDIAVSLEPNLAPKDKLYYYVDGKQQGEGQTSLTYEVSGLERGAHTVQVKVEREQEANNKNIKKTRQIIASTDVVTFYQYRSFKRSSTAVGNAN